MQLLNGDEIDAAEDVTRVSIRENERLVRKVVGEEIMSALKKMKSGKAAGMDGTVVEILKSGDINIIDWLLRIFNRCMGLVLYQRIGRQCVSSRYTKGKVTEEIV